MKPTTYSALRDLADHVLEVSDISGLSQLLTQSLPPLLGVDEVSFLIWNRRLDTFQGITQGRTKLAPLKSQAEPAPEPRARFLISDGTVLDTGSSSGDGALLPLMARSGLVGMLVLGPRQDRRSPPFDPRTAQFLSRLASRVALAETRHAGLFLSLHFNSAAPDQVQAGLETYCLTPVGMPSTVTRGFSDDPSLAFPNNAFDSQNLQLAIRAHRALLRLNGNHDRGVRHARYLAVLRGQSRPAILVEGGYLSNPHEARLIANPAYRQKLAEALAQALGACVKSQS